MITRPPVKPLYGSSFTPATAIYPLQGQKHEPKTIEWLWGMFNTFPKSRPQLRNTQNAAARVHRRRNKPILPPRKAYESTVDYYEAYVPLFVAQRRFIMLTNPSLFMRLVTHACRTVLPIKLF